ncbi:phosphotransferase system enzyme I (PtsI) [Melghirimyces profundicolus]|uniref:Phosphoenolpyruvate-protein phosphotransferase n=1 Tax=Melghirimyces profundicolus TaxID=1242148 RepID=A0A2T6BXM5_9BACL|nr:phosphoenolpyruvate--protein phosphotransferase [Melghirimyces profundicolus]PTX60824.1 phosphotransferase system enzyme I (PtsI) [Melghirimyces profundicolus]
MTAERINGVGAAPGLAIGQAVHWRKDHPKVETHTVDNTDQEVARLEETVDQAKEQLTRLRETTRERMGEDEAGIFDAHLSFLDDPAYIGEMKNRIRNQKRNAESICAEVTEEMSSMLASLPDEYMQARADDIRDVGNRILLLLSGIEPFDPSLLQPGSIVVAEELAPSDTAQFPPGIAAMVTARGSKTAHAAIMARTLGIPAVLGLGDHIDRIQDGDTLIADGEKGTIILSPDPETEEQARKEMERQRELREAALKKADEDAVTSDGKRIQVFANIGSPADVEAALENRAEGIGLFRTEFLYLENDQWPTEEEQIRAYRKVLEAFGDKPVVIRTLDIGGDKDLPYAELPKEENPFLGHRAIRFCLDNPEIFKTQLRALLRAGVYGNLWIMFPMVESVSEIREAKRLLEEARTELEREGVETASPKVGIMVEVPAAAVTADILAKEVDFMSIGTNDLTQYTLAADRGNERVAPLYDAAHPAVLRLVRQTCEAALKEGIVAGMCGELAGDPHMTEILIGLGLDELSMSAGTIPEVKEKVRRTDTEKARTLADEALTRQAPEEVRSLAKEEN